MVVLVPVYLTKYGPTNFLYFCDLSLLLTTVALWLRWSLPASMAIVGILGAQLLWTLDLISGLLDVRVLGMTDYMFDSSTPLFLRGLSLFHLWLPILLLWLVRRLGYDRRALWTWTVLGTVVMVICYAFLPAPPAPADQPGLPVNVNLVFGFSDSQPQTWLPPDAYFALLLLAMPALFYLPTHLLLTRFIPPPAAGVRNRNAA